MVTRRQVIRIPVLHGGGAGIDSRQKCTASACRFRVLEVPTVKVSSCDQQVIRCILAQESGLNGIVAHYIGLRISPRGVIDCIAIVADLCQRRKQRAWYICIAYHEVI
jgi:hypothetical protein